MPWIVARQAPDQDTQKRVQWVCDMLNACEGIAAKIGVTPDAIAAQGAEESGWGATTQGRFGLFGQKAGSDWTGLRVLCTTREWVWDDQAQQIGHYETIEAWFRDYGSLQECVDDHFDFLMKYPNYREAGVFDGLGDEHYFNALYKAGYATDPNYAKTCLQVEDTLDRYYKSYLRFIDPSTPVPVDPVMPERMLHIGLAGNDVMLLQSALTTQGFYNGAIDGLFGHMTYDAVEIAQEKKGITIDGLVGEETRKVLGIT